jgi:hypothetical protein
MQRGEFGQLIDTVQRNCDLADALHAREKSLCTYLLGMREYFRWSEQLPLGAAPDRARLSRWIAKREQTWDELGERADIAFDRLPFDDAIDPFDEAGANRQLAGHALVYGAGIGLFGAPLFFLATRQSEQMRDGAQVIVADRELARGVVAAPAASREGTILIRLDALRRWLWTRAEAAQRGSRERTFIAALNEYGVAIDPVDAIERMARGEVETLVLHELGELRAGELLGASWEDMLAGIDDRRTELTLRAIRDLLADCLVTLPQLLAREAHASLRFWFATFDGLRRELAPQFVEAYCVESNRIDTGALGRAVLSAEADWLAVARDLCAAWHSGGSASVIEATRRLAKPH